MLEQIDHLNIQKEENQIFDADAYTKIKCFQTEKCELKPIETLLLDFQMPFKNGVEVANEIYSLFTKS